MATKNLNLSIERPSESVPARIVQAVRQAIVEGALEPGRRLTERELCELTGVSRTSIREAILHLQNLGLVEATTTRGIRVAVLSAADVRHIFEVRAALEPMAAELFAIHASDDEIDELRACLAAADDNAEHQLTMVSRFDELLARGSDNPLIWDLLSPLHTRIHALRRLSISRTGRLTESTSELRAIADAIGSRDPQKASALSRAHVEAAEKSAITVAESMDLGADS